MCRESLLETGVEKNLERILNKVLARNLVQDDLERSRHPLTLSLPSYVTCR